MNQSTRRETAHYNKYLLPTLPSSAAQQLQHTTAGTSTITRSSCKITKKLFTVGDNCRSLEDQKSSHPPQANVEALEEKPYTSTADVPYTITATSSKKVITSLAKCIMFKNLQINVMATLQNHHKCVCVDGDNISHMLCVGKHCFESTPVTPYQQLKPVSVADKVTEQDRKNRKMQQDKEYNRLVTKATDTTAARVSEMTRLATTCVESYGAMTNSTHQEDKSPKFLLVQSAGIPCTNDSFYNVPCPINTNQELVTDTPTLSTSDLTSRRRHFMEKQVSKYMQEPIVTTSDSATCALPCNMLGKAGVVRHKGTNVFNTDLPSPQLVSPALMEAVKAKGALNCSQSVNMLLFNKLTMKQRVQRFNQTLEPQRLSISTGNLAETYSDMATHAIYGNDYNVITEMDAIETTAMPPMGKKEVVEVIEDVEEYKILSRFEALKDLLSFAAPASISLAMSFLLTAIPLGFVGNTLGEQALAGASVGYFLLSIAVIYPASGLMVALDTLCSNEYGRDPESDQLGLLLQRGLIVVTTLLCPFVLFCTFACEPLLRLAYSREIAHIAVEFLHFAPVYLVPAICFVGFTKFLSNQMLPLIPAVAVGVGTVVTPLLQSICVRFGVRYVMLGMSVSASVQLFVVILLTFWRPATRKTFGSIRIREALQWEEILVLIKIAVPAAIFVAAEAAAFDFSVLLAVALSDSVGSAWSALMNYEFILVSVAGGFSAAACAKVGAAIGANQPMNAKTYATTAVVASAVWGLSINCSIILLFYNILVRVFGGNVTEANKVKWLFLILHVADMVQYTFQGVLVGMNKNHLGAKCLLFALWGVGVPLCVFFALNGAIYIERGFDYLWHMFYYTSDSIGSNSGVFSFLESLRGILGVASGVTVGLLLLTPLLIGNLMRFDWDNISTTNTVGACRGRKEGKGTQLTTAGVVLFNCCVVILLRVALPVALSSSQLILLNKMTQLPYGTTSDVVKRPGIHTYINADPVYLNLSVLTASAVVSGEAYGKSSSSMEFGIGGYLGIGISQPLWWMRRFYQLSSLLQGLLSIGILYIVSSHHFMGKASNAEQKQLTSSMSKESKDKKSDTEEDSTGTTTDQRMTNNKNINNTIRNKNVLNTLLKKLLIFDNFCYTKLISCFFSVEWFTKGALLICAVFLCVIHVFILFSDQRNMLTKELMLQMAVSIDTIVVYAFVLFTVYIPAFLRQLWLVFMSLNDAAVQRKAHRKVASDERYINQPLSMNTSAVERPIGVSAAASTSNTITSDSTTFVSSSGTTFLTMPFTVVASIKSPNSCNTHHTTSIINANQRLWPLLFASVLFALTILAYYSQSSRTLTVSEFVAPQWASSNESDGAFRQEFNRYLMWKFGSAKDKQVLSDSSLFDTATLEKFSLCRQVLGKPFIPEVEHGIVWPALLPRRIMNFVTGPESCSGDLESEQQMYEDSVEVMSKEVERMSGRLYDSGRRIIEARNLLDAMNPSDISETTVVDPPPSTVNTVKSIPSDSSLDIVALFPKQRKRFPRPGRTFTDYDRNTAELLVAAQCPSSTQVPVVIVEDLFRNQLGHDFNEVFPSDLKENRRSAAEEWGRSLEKRFGSGQCDTAYISEDRMTFRFERSSSYDKEVVPQCIVYRDNRTLVTGLGTTSIVRVEQRIRGYSVIPPYSVPENAIQRPRYKRLANPIIIPALPVRHYRVPLLSESVSVHCSTEEEYHNHPIPQRILKPVENDKQFTSLIKKRKLKEIQSIPNVITIVHDAVSRQEIKRSLYRVGSWLEYMRSGGPKSGVGVDNRSFVAIEMLGASTLGHSTAGNLVPALSGDLVNSHLSNIFTLAKTAYKDKFVGVTVSTNCETFSNLINMQVIEKQFVHSSSVMGVPKKGTETVVTQDGNGKNVSDTLKFGADAVLSPGFGGGHLSLDKEAHAAMCHVQYGGLEGNLQGPYSIKQRCIGGRHVHDHVLEYLEDLIVMLLEGQSRNGAVTNSGYGDDASLLLSSLKQRLFLIGYFLEGHEGAHAVIGLMDRSLYRFLRRLEVVYRYFDDPNNLLVLVSDHGNHMGPYYEWTSIGRVERTMPYVVWVGNTPARTEKESMALKVSRHSLTSTRDLYQTFVDLYHLRSPITTGRSYLNQKWLNSKKRTKCSDIQATSPCTLDYCAT